MSSRCKYCASLFLSDLVNLTSREFHGHEFPQSAYYQHHSCFQDLEHAANDGCDLCQLILECFKGTPYDGDLIWPNEWEGEGCDVGSSMYAEAKCLDVSDVKISINSEDVWSFATLGSVKVLDNLLVQVGPRQEDPYDEETGVYAEEGLPKLRLILSTSRESPVRVNGLRVGRLDVEPDLGSQQNFDIARNWLHECQNSHDSCLSRNPPELPTRVIDVGNSHSPENPRLFLAQGKRAEYVALSHCWGGSITPLLKVDSLSSFQQELPYSSLPANFKDAITITRRLGVRYLWIDSLCIIQDSRDDWAQESKKMGLIYRNSTLTVFALASKGSTSGILRHSVESMVDPKPVYLRVFPDDERRAEIRVERKDLQEEDLLDLDLHCPLAGRGWTLQESVLSPRHLYYGTRQIYWKCVYEYQAADGTPEGAKTPHYIYEDLSAALWADIFKTPRVELPDRKSILKDYYTMAQSYSQRQLTYDLDKLPAFSGMASRLQPFVGGEYLAGVWESDFRNGLLWYSEQIYARHVNEYRVPSWSWAVTNQEVLLVNEFYAPSPTQLELIEAKVTLRDANNLFGEVTAAHIVVKGLTKRVVRSLQVLHGNDIVDRMGTGYWDDPLGDAELSLGVHSITTLLSASTGDDKYILSIMTKAKSAGRIEEVEVEVDKFAEEEYYALLVQTDDAAGGEVSESSAHCLVVKEVGGREGVYERVGYVTIDYPRREWLETWNLQTLTLV